MSNFLQIKRGEIYYANLCPIVGSVQGGVRPVVILQNNNGNLHSSTTIMAAITSVTHKTHLPTHIVFKSDHMKKESIVLLEQIRTIDKSRLGRFVGTMDNETMKRVDKAILISFGLDKKYYPVLCESLQKISSMKPKKKRRNVVKTDSRGNKIKIIEQEIANLDEWQKKLLSKFQKVHRE